jgi:hypothetical protein
MAKNRGIRVTWCPIEQDYCDPSCYFRMGDYCHFKSPRGRRVKETGEEKKRSKSK